MELVLSPDLAAVLWKNLPFFLAFLSAVVVYVIDFYWHEEDKDILIYLAVAGLVGSIILFWDLWLSGNAASFMGLPVARLSTAFLVVILCMAVPFILTAQNYYQAREINVAGFVVCFLFAVFGIISALATDNLLVVFVGLVIASSAATFMYKLYGGAVSKKDIQKFWSYFLIADLVFCFGVVFYFGATGRFSIGSPAELIGVINASHTASYFRIAMAIMAVALFAKMAVVPLHWWVLDVAGSRSVPLIGTILFFYRAAVVLVTLKLLAPIVSIWGPFLGIPIFVIAIITMSWANLAAVRVQDIKSLLAYSSIAQVGYMLTLFPVMAVEGGDGLSAIVVLVTAFLIAHLGVLAVLQMLSASDSDHTEFTSLDGLGRTRPWAACLLGFFFLALAGIPPLVGFLARFMMVKEIARGGYFLVLIIVSINIAVSMYYYTRPIIRMFFFRPSLSSTAYGDEFGYSLVAVIAFSVLASIFLGIFPESFIRWIHLSIAAM